MQARLGPEDTLSKAVLDLCAVTLDKYVSKTSKGEILRDSLVMWKKFRSAMRTCKARNLAQMCKSEFSTDVQVNTMASKDTSTKTVNKNDNKGSSRLEFKKFNSGLNTARQRHRRPGKHTTQV